MGYPGALSTLSTGYQQGQASPSRGNRATMSNSIFVQGIDKEVLPVCATYGTGLIPWSPLNRGWLAGKYRKGQDLDPQSRVARGDQFTDRPDSPSEQKKLELVEQLIPMAEEAGTTLSHYALARTVTSPTVTAPIIGPRTTKHLEDNLQALDVHVLPGHLRRIDDLVPPGTDV